MHQDQKFLPVIPNFHPSPFHLPYHPPPSYIPQHQLIPFLYPPKPQVIVPPPHLSQAMTIQSQLVPLLETLLTQMKDARHN